MANETQAVVKTPEYSKDIKDLYECTLNPGKHILGSVYNRKVIDTRTMTTAEIESFMDNYKDQKIFTKKVKAKVEGKP